LRLFWDQLRKELGEEVVWKGVAPYTSTDARRLVDFRDFQQSMEQASRRNLQQIFNQGVYH
jgi:aminopeptidase N